MTPWKLRSIHRTPIKPSIFREPGEWTAHTDNFAVLEQERSWTSGQLTSTLLMLQLQFLQSVEKEKKKKIRFTSLLKLRDKRDSQNMHRHVFNFLRTWIWKGERNEVEDQEAQKGNVKAENRLWQGITKDSPIFCCHYLCMKSCCASFFGRCLFVENKITFQQFRFRFQSHSILILAREKYH